MISEDIEGSRRQITDGAECLTARGPTTADDSYSNAALGHVNISIAQIYRFGARM